MFTMIPPVGAALLLCLVVSTGEAGREKRSCKKKYQILSPAHTMCFEDNVQAKRVPLTEEVKQLIVDRHNEIRSAVNPSATNMQKVQWDNKLAKVAEKWAMQCSVASHDLNRREPDYPGFVGQNVAAGYKTWLDAINGWERERKDFVFGKWSKATGHYIQQVFASASHIGCGQAMCSGNANFTQYVCNYYHGTGSGLPYENGTSCARCPQTCVNGTLCDCGGEKPCFHGGSFDINTCKCTCPRLWSGNKNCTKLKCPEEDFAPWCAYTTWNATVECPKYHMYRTTCPIRCGICPRCHNVTRCMNGGDFKINSCKCNCPLPWEGDFCTKKMDCPKKDHAVWCASNYPWNTEVECETKNYKKECPIRCGVCSNCAPGLTCYNGGKLDMGSCQCKCKPLWSGADCSQRNCPIKDLENWCDNLKHSKNSTTPADSDCVKHQYFRERCPFKCGLCP